MRRIAVIAITVCTTLAVPAAIVAWNFEIYASPAGVMLLTDAQSEECLKGGGCSVLSMRQLERAVDSMLGLNQPNQPQI